MTNKENLNKEGCNLDSYLIKLSKEEEDEAAKKEAEEKEAKRKEDELYAIYGGD